MNNYSTIQAHLSNRPIVCGGMKKAVLPPAVCAFGPNVSPLQSETGHLRGRSRAARLILTWIREGGVVNRADCPLEKFRPGKLDFY